MASSDDEGEAVPNTVSDYSFVDVNNKLISFSELPLEWDKSESLNGSINEIGLDGKTDNGLQKIFEQVTAWKFDISFAKPEIFVLSKKNNWIKLLKPRKSFEKSIRTILITVHCLNFVKRNPETSGKALWDHLSKVFSLYEPRPSENDLVDHMNLIGEAVKRDEVLARAKVLATFLEEKPRKKKVFDEEVGNKPGFIHDEVIHEGEEEEDTSDAQEEDLFEPVCAICDNGGDILCCEGRCLRSFHATVEAGSDSGCDTLGFSEEQVKAMATFECKNCQYKQHQCFVCGQLGSSDKLAGAEVFQCVTGTCGYFYHPHCVAEVLQFKYGDRAKDLESKIAAGKPFVCPLHICYNCKELEPEDKNDEQKQFSVCRRCPKAYHRKCLPRKIAFQDDEDEDIIQRAWEGLLPNKILIYCLKHKIEDELATPIRDHIRFPDVDQEKKKKTLEPVARRKIVIKQRVHTSEGAAVKKFAAKQSQGTEKLSTPKMPVDSSSTRERRLSIPDSSKKQKLTNNSKMVLKKPSPGKQNKSTGCESKASLGEMLYALISKDSDPGKRETSDWNEQRKTNKPVGKEINNSVMLDADSKNRILSIVKDAESTITLEDVTRKHRAPTTHAHAPKYGIQTITLGKVEGSIEALRAALQKLEEGGSLKDAKAVCEPGLLNQIAKWKSKLRVYLAPFLHGVRYTSFGRHFTQVQKLQAIVDKLHCYVQDGDMVVDFCCGANDFSCLMKEKLDKVGKSCAYKNYDIIQAKNDFNFEKRDWMSVLPSELPRGSQLIMGLNPPFGVNAALANKFIDKALEFKPKLLILIVPQETERLDQKKRTPYDLVWEDHELLFGKAFYLPGSVDVNDKQMEDWNVNTPPLSLWSRPDWTAKHKEIAQRHDHLSRVEEMMQLEEHHYEIDVTDYPPESHDLHHESLALAGGHGLQDVRQLQDQGAKFTESHTEGFCNGSGIEDARKYHGNGGSPATGNFDRGNKNSRKRRRVSEEKSSEERRPLPEEKSSEERRPLPRHSSPSRSGGRSLGRQHPEMQSNIESQREGYQHFDQKSSSGSRPQLQRGYGGRLDDGTGRRNYYSEEPYSNSENQRPHPTGHSTEFAFGVPGQQFMSYQRRRPYINDPYEGYGREVGIAAQVNYYGHQAPDSLNYRDNYPPSAALGFSTPYGQSGSTIDSGYSSMNTSAMQRYAPRLDELNPARMNNVQSPQQFPGRSDTYNLAPPPARPTSMGFAPGPYDPRFSQQSTSGWLNE